MTNFAFGILIKKERFWHNFDVGRILRKKGVWKEVALEFVSVSVITPV
jgi:hypothetical protein